MRIAAAAAIAATLLLTGAAQAAGGDKTVKDWVGVCDNLATCSAFGFSDDNGDRDSWVKITRAAGPEAAPKVVVAYDIPDTQADATWTLTLDGQPVAGVGPLRRLQVGCELKGHPRSVGRVPDDHPVVVILYPLHAK